jgi:small subunit ribosomal protein S27Ae
MAKEKAKKKSASKRDIFKVKDGKIERTKRHCPKCGPGTFMGEHKDRVSCGKCGYTEFKKK